MHFLREKFAFFIVFLYICIVFIIVNKAYMKKGDIIIAAIEKYWDKYDYSRVKYVNSKTKVCIVCPEHGEFWQTPSKHLLGQGCPKCAIKKRNEYKDF